MRVATQQFSKGAYDKILDRYSNRFTDYLSLVRHKPEEWALLRHDVEFSVRRAVIVAHWDYEKSVSSTFFFQVRAGTYNLAAPGISGFLQEIRELGHEVGLHTYIPEAMPHTLEALELELNLQRQLFEGMTGLRLRVFSFHRPPDWVLQIRKDFIGGLLNVYGPTFFEHTFSPLAVKYFADSRHAFNYGHPLDKHSFTKVQLLLHPDEWTDNGLDLVSNFTALEDELNGDLRKVFIREAEHFREG